MTRPTHQPEASLRRRTLGGYRYVRMRWRVLFGLIDLAGTIMFGCLRRLRLGRLGLGRRERSKPVERILLVQFDHLGDAIITTAMFGPLKERFPEARIEVLAAPWNRAVFESVAEVDRVHICPENRFASGRGFAWIAGTLIWGLRMRRRRFEVAIDVRGEFPHNVLLWLSGASRRVGWASGGGGFLLTDYPRFVANRPEVESRAALLGCLGIRPDETLLPEFRPGNLAKKTAADAWGEVAGRPLRAVLHIGAGTSAKRWPAEHWRGLVERLAAEGRFAVALVGTGEDKQTARAILGTAGPAGVVDWTGRFGIAELAGVIGQADVTVGADSGPAHLAAAVGTPVLALFSGTNSTAQWQPRGRMVRTLDHATACSPCHLTECPLADHACMRGITPEEVMKQITKMLGPPARKPAGAFAETKGTTL